MLIKTRAIVLRNIKYGEQKIIVDLLTETEGRVSVVTRIPQTQRGKLKKQYFQPMTLLEVDVDIRGRADLQHLRDVRLSHPYSDIPFNPFKLSITLFLAEFVYYSTRIEQQNSPLFAYIENSLLWLDACPANYSNFHLVFMIRLTLFLGFFPNIETYHVGSCFDLRSGCFSMEIPAHADFIRSDEAEQMINLMRLNYSTMHLFRMTRQQRSRCVDVILAYYRLHVPDFPDMKTLEVLRQNND